MAGYAEKVRQARGKGRRGFGDGGDGEGGSVPSGKMEIPELNTIIAFNSANEGSNYLNHILRHLKNGDTDADRTASILISEDIARIIAEVMTNGAHTKALPETWEDLYQRFDSGEALLKQVLEKKYQLTEESVTAFTHVYQEICTHLIGIASGHIEIAEPEYSLH